MYSHEAPVLGARWSSDGSRIASAGCDKIVRLYDPVSSQTTQLGLHDAPIRCLRWVEAAGGSPILATASWDKTLRYWDGRQQQPIATVKLAERAYAMDAVHPFLVVGTAERNIQMVDLNNPTVIFKTTQSPLKWQTRVLACFPHGPSGFAIGSIEGRVAIQYADDKHAVNNFSFKCHRDGNSIYAVNAISFHPLHGTFSTAGSDGTFNFWDKDAKQRLKNFGNVGGPISATAFGKSGKIFAYAVSYGWSKGVAHRSPTAKNTVYLHAVKEEDIRPKISTKKR